MRRLLLCCVVAVAGFTAATSLDLESSEIAAASPAAAASASATGLVTRVIDGDTLDVRLPGGGRERVRILGIDSPEMRPKERCAKQATEAARRLAQGETVGLVGDRTQATRDRYGRLLAYVTLPGGLDMGRRLLVTGNAKVYVFAGRPFLRVGVYRAAEKNARGRGFGLWGNCSSIVTVIPALVPPVRHAPPTAPPPTTTTTTAGILPVVPPTTSTSTPTTTAGTTTGTTTTGTTTTTPSPRP